MRRLLAIFIARCFNPPHALLFHQDRIKGTVMMARTEKEKMLAGELYFADDEELVRERERARVLTFEFNQASPVEKEKKQAILKQLIRAKGSLYIEAPFNCDYGYNIQVGVNFYANYGCTILDVHTVTIGDNALLAPNVQIYTAAHPVDPVERLTGKEFARPVVIGNNVWIGGGVIICPGVSIGDNVTIGAGSVVTRGIPANVIAAGNPCKVIRNL